MTILTIVAAPLVAVLTTSITSQKSSRERTLAEQTAMSQIENIRSLPYTSVGIVGGNPSGTLAATQSIVKPGLNASVKTKVVYVADAAKYGYVTDADYKSVTITVVRSSDSKVLAKEQTFVSPPGKGAWSGPNQAIVKVQVVDYATNQPLQNATINLSTGPSAPRSDTTDASGSVIFPDLTPNPTSGGQQYYDLAVAASGYTTLSDDTSPNSPAHVQLATGQTFNTVLRVYKAGTMYVNIQNAGAAYSGSSTVTVSSSRGSQTFTVTGPTLTVTQVNGEPVIPGIQYTVTASDASLDYATVTQTSAPSYPSDLTTTVTVNMQPPVALTFTIKNTSGTVQSGATVTLTGGPLSVNLTGTTNTSGQVTFNVPASSITGYSASVTKSTKHGSWSGNVTGATSTTVTIS